MQFVAHEPPDQGNIHHEESESIHKRERYNWVIEGGKLLKAAQVQHGA